MEKLAPPEALPSQQTTEQIQSTPLWMICLICASFSLLSAVATYYFVSSHAPSQKFAVIDMTALMKAKLTQLQKTPSVESAAIESEALVFSTALKSQFALYESSGVLLVNSQAILNKPSGVEDVTNAVAKKIGVDLSSK